MWKFYEFHFTYEIIIACRRFIAIKNEIQLIRCSLQETKSFTLDLHLMRKLDIANTADDFQCLYVNQSRLNLLGTIYANFFIDEFYSPQLLTLPLVK